MPETVGNDIFPLRSIVKNVNPPTQMDNYLENPSITEENESLNVHKNFQINDITFIYRAKNAR